MGNICRKFKGEENDEIVNYFEKTPLGDISVEKLKIPKERFLCPICRSIPEILGIHTDNNKIEMKCRECGIQTISIKKFIEKTQKSDYNEQCHNCENAPTKYCIECSKPTSPMNVCDKCWSQKHVDVDEKTKKQKEHKNIPYNKKNSKCLIHGNDYVSYCEDCEENFCGEEKEKEHYGHKIHDLSALVEEAKKSRQIIIEKNRILSLIVKINHIINNDSDKNLENIARLYNSILEENDRNNPKEFEAMLEWKRMKNENSEQKK
jgi:hypothetical protein